MTRPAAAKIRAVIVDDEELARQVLREFIAAHADIELIAECANGFEAVKIVTEQKPDLMFLDIQMPKLDGFEVLELIGTGTAVVFVTAYDSYAIKAFEVHAVDYLLKPFGADRFEAALGRAKERLGGKLPHFHIEQRTEVAVEQKVDLALLSERRTLAPCSDAGSGNRAGGGF